MKRTIVLKRNDDGSYTVTVPALPGCVTQGDNIVEALAHAKEAIESHVEGLLILGKTIPNDITGVTLELQETEEILIYKVEVEPDLDILSTETKRFIPIPSNPS
jgi:predicted RNase H-like HicB family nuclease